MSRLIRPLLRPVVSDAGVARVAQLACFAAGPAVLVVAVTAVARLASSPGEVLIGVLAGSAVALLLVVMGLVVPNPRGQTPS